MGATYGGALASLCPRESPGGGEVRAGRATRDSKMAAQEAQTWQAQAWRTQLYAMAEAAEPADRPVTESFRNGDIVYNPGHARGLPCEVLGRPLHKALTHLAGQIHHMIQRPHTN